MNPIEIRQDSKLVKQIAAQAQGEKVDSDQAEKAAKLIAEQASDPTPHNKYVIGQLVGFTVNEMTKPQSDWLALPQTLCKHTSWCKMVMKRGGEQII